MWNYFQIEINSIDYICCCALAHTKGYYSQIFSGWVEVKATLPTGKLKLLTLELHPPTRRWESVNPPAGS